MIIGTSATAEENMQANDMLAKDANAYDCTRLPANNCNDEDDDKDRDFEAFFSNANFLFTPDDNHHNHSNTNKNNNNDNLEQELIQLDDPEQLTWCYENKLYQPMNCNGGSNGQQDISEKNECLMTNDNSNNAKNNRHQSSTTNQYDEDYLFSRELKFRESTAQLNSLLIGDEEDEDEDAITNDIVNKILAEDVGHHHNCDDDNDNEAEHTMNDSYSLNDLFGESSLPGSPFNQLDTPESTQPDSSQSTNAYMTSSSNEPSTSNNNNHLISSSPSSFSIGDDFTFNNEPQHEQQTHSQMKRSHLEIEPNMHEESDQIYLMTSTIDPNPLKKRLGSDGAMISSYLTIHDQQQQQQQPQRQQHQFHDPCSQSSNSSSVTPALSIAGSASSSVAPELTKYRRRTANARERIRMREINRAFEKLKKVVPLEWVENDNNGVPRDPDEPRESARPSRSSKQALNGQSRASSSRGSRESPAKLTKITTLRLAATYISQLSNLLNSNPADIESSSGTTGSTPESSLANNLKSIKQARTRRKRRGSQNKEKRTSNKIEQEDKRLDGSSADARGDDSKCNPNNTHFVVMQSSQSQQQNHQQPQQSEVDQSSIITNLIDSKQSNIVNINNLQSQQHYHNSTSSTSATLIPNHNHSQSNQQQHHQVQQQQHFYPNQSTNQPARAISISGSPVTNNPANTLIRTDQQVCTPVTVAIIGAIQTPNSSSSTIQTPLIQSTPQIIRPTQYFLTTQRQNQQQQLHGRTSITPSATPIATAATMTVNSNNCSNNPISVQGQPVTLTLDDLGGFSLVQLGPANNNTNHLIFNNTNNLQQLQGMSCPIRIVPQTAQNQSTVITSPNHPPVQCNAILQTNNGNGEQRIQLVPNHLFTKNQQTSIGNQQAIQIHSPTTLVNAISPTTILRPSQAFNSSHNQQTCNQQPQYHQIIQTGTKLSTNQQQIPLVNVHQQQRFITLTSNGVLQDQNQLRAGQPTKLIYIQPNSTIQDNNNNNNNSHIIRQHVPKQHQSLNTINKPPGLQQALPIQYILTTSRNDNNTIKSPPASQEVVSVDQQNKQSANLQANERTRMFSHPIKVTPCPKSINDNGPNKQVKTSSEENIRQLVTSLATNINEKKEENKQQITSPSVSESIKLDDNNMLQIQQSSQGQLKRTYRFHNYDGSTMINNHNNRNLQRQTINQTVLQDHEQQQTPRTNYHDSNNINDISRHKDHMKHLLCETTTIVIHPSMTDENPNQLNSYEQQQERAHQITSSPKQSNTNNSTTSPRSSDKETTRMNNTMLSLCNQTSSTSQRSRQNSLSSNCSTISSISSSANSFICGLNSPMSNSMVNGRVSTSIANSHHRSSPISIQSESSIADSNIKIPSKRNPEHDNRRDQNQISSKDDFNSKMDQQQHEQEHNLLATSQSTMAIVEPPAN